MKNTLLTPNTLTIEQITKAMVFHSGEPFATSTQIAKHFGMNHRDLLRKIRSFHSFEELIGSVKLRSRIRIIKGKDYPYFELDADAFVFTCMSFTGKKAEAFKWVFIKAFKLMAVEAITAKIKAETNKDNQLWQETRTQGKLAHRSYTDTIKEFCLYAEDQRGNSYSINKAGHPTNKPCPYYIHFQRVAYQKAGINFKKGLLPKRDTLSGAELERVESIEANIANTVSDLLDQGLHYKKIFKSIKNNDTSNTIRGSK